MLESVHDRLECALIYIYVCYKTFKVLFEYAVVRRLFHPLAFYWLESILSRFVFEWIDSSQ